LREVIFARGCLVFLAHGYSVLRTGLRGRALTGRRTVALASLRSVFRPCNIAQSTEA